MASVKWSADAVRDLEKIDFVVAQRIAGKVGWLGENFSEIVPEKLRGNLKNLYKLRVGDYRVLYSVRKKMIVVEAVSHRSEAYR